MRRLRFLLPVVVLAALIGLLAFGLTRNPHILPSALIGKPAPQFSLPKVAKPEQILTSAAFQGQVSVVNVWASWCVACRAEHAVVSELARRSDAVIFGLNYKDQRPAAMRWLEHFGNPYRAVAFDASGSVAIDWGVTGVPETFIIDANGIVRYKQTGPVTLQVLEQKILPLLKRLQKEAA
ncbi:MAG: DsbE family thiol:disulfide interchange protein [Salinisphaera sp.]|nr:DsbE family thiol:disulfide interchange protein [Salinisphaera sp.]